MPLSYLLPEPPLWDCCCFLSACPTCCQSSLSGTAAASSLPVLLAAEAASVFQSAEDPELPLAKNPEHEFAEVPEQAQHANTLELMRIDDMVS